MNVSSRIPYSRPVSAGITALEFVAAILKDCGDVQRLPDGETAAPIGLAISGGVDSMALAVLCSRLQHDASVKFSYPNIANLNFRAFIVDHNVRIGSEAEAKAASGVLRSRGIPTEVLRIKWPVRTPKKLSNFESLARRLRFRLLGQACARCGIKSLLLAHHADDQAETILARLIAGHRGPGLAGIKASSAIPECYGLYGVHESCADEVSCRALVTTQSLSHPQPRLLAETGGIQVFRPLLDFSKSQLIATCEANCMPWFEDDTNHDPTITTRNAIRHLYQQHNVPSALSKPRMIMLAKAIKTKLENRSSLVNRCLSATRVSSFDTSTGTLKVQFPCLNHYAATSMRPKDLPSVELASELLRKFIALVTPQEHVELSSLRGAVNRIFPELFHPSQPQLQTTTSFTVASLLFQQVPSNIQAAVDIPIISSPTHSSICWFISRQPCPSGKFDDHTVRIPATSPPAWFLFDGRFWMKIYSSDPSSNLVVQLLSPADLKPFVAQFTPVTRKVLSRTLAERAPGKVRWTLPAILHHDIVTSCYRLISLPTLYLDAPGAHVFGKWEVRYKKIYTDHMYLT
ncbi:hypothetical protein K3495_g10009 [Podosphaera aphanis]|nr:hypothetical protein K3495_g10009 [Podosphaera aphanis]